MRQRGFTLLEVLVMLVVLGLVLAAVGQGVQFGLRTTDIQARQVAAGADADAVDRLLRRLVEQADPGFGNDAPDFQGGPSSLGLTTALNDETPPVDAALRVEGGRLVLRTTLHRHAVALGPKPSPSVVVLLDGVRQVQFAYWGSAKPGGAGSWLAEWAQKDIPALIRIRLSMAPGRPRWPDIVAATVKQRASG